MGPGVTTSPARYNPPVSAHDTAASVEREIAVLSLRIERAKAELAGLRMHGPEPRGMMAGVIAGMLVVVAAFAAFAWWVGAVVGRVTG
jgi:hypothetical protein